MVEYFFCYIKCRKKTYNKIKGCDLMNNLPCTMKALVVEGINQLTYKDVPMPKIKADEVLGKKAMAEIVKHKITVCGSFNRY